MPTLDELVDEVKANLQGYALRQDRITYVANAAGLTTTSTQITVGSASNLAKGIIEIDDELIWIDSFDKANNVLNVIPGFGRGYQGTTASPHAQYAPVTLSPTFPRNSIKKAINDTINSFYPKLWIINSYTFTFNTWNWCTKNFNTSLYIINCNRTVENIIVFNQIKVRLLNIHFHCLNKVTNLY